MQLYIQLINEKFIKTEYNNSALNNIKITCCDNWYNQCDAIITAQMLDANIKLNFNII